MSDTAAPDFRRIPVIDVSALEKGDAATVDVTAAEIRGASIEVGFLYVSGHKVPVVEDYYREVFKLGQGILEALRSLFACRAIFSDADIFDRWCARACSTIRRRLRA
jgi:hypothetical protein